MPQLRVWKVFKKRKVLWENKLEQRENGIMAFDRRRTELHIETQRIRDGPNLAAIFLFTFIDADVIGNSHFSLEKLI